MSCSISQASNGTRNECLEDSVVQVILAQGIKALNVRKLFPEPVVHFNSGYTDDLSFTQYHFILNGIKFEFNDTVHEKNSGNITERAVLIDGAEAIRCSFDNEFAIDSIQMHIDYSESEVYCFDNIASYLLVVSHPMNWTGLMTKYSFFQLIGIKERAVAEFISDDQ
jgi:hypothetical protein